MFIDINRSVRLENMTAPALVLALRGGKLQQNKLDKKPAEQQRAVEDQLSVVRMLLAAKANPNTRGSFDVHSLHEVHTGELTTLLIEARADINALTMRPGSWPPLMVAWMDKRPVVVKALLSACADINLALGHDKWNYQHEACASASREVIKQHLAEAPVLMQGVLSQFLFRPLAALVVSYMGLPTAATCASLIRDPTPPKPEPVQLSPTSLYS